MVLRRRKRTGRAAILGCGPAGIFAAHALVQSEWEVSIFSKHRKSHMFGAQYLHQPIPGLSVAPSQTIHYRLEGGVQQYAEKVYEGKLSARSVSPAYLSGPAEAWDIREAYNRGWSNYYHLVVNMHVEPSVIRSLCQSFDLVVSTIPAPAVCGDLSGKHEFYSQRIWAIGDAPERGIYAPVRTEPWTVRCNGEKEPRWYRASNVFGYNTVEWPGPKAPPVENIAAVDKPISTNCDCWSDLGNFVRGGRFGVWRKGVLSHEIFNDLRKEYR